MKQAIRGAGLRFVVWVKRHRRLLGIISASVLALTIVAQLVYPPTMALPFTSVVGERTDFKSREAIVASVQKRFTKTSLELKTGNKTYREDLSVFGASINPDEMATKVLEYPLLIRIVPFSFLWYQPQVQQFTTKLDDSQLQQTAELARIKLTSEPRDASLTIKEGELQVKVAANGRQVTADMVSKALKQSSFAAGNNMILIEGARTDPRVSDKAIAAVKQQAETLLARTVTITVDESKDFIPSRAEIAGWITIQADDKQSVSMGLATDKIAAYLGTLNETVQIKPTVTTVNLRDGKEQGRQVGKMGRAIVTSKAAETVRDQLAATTSEPALIGIATEDVQPPVEYTRSYTSSQAGLSAYVQHTTSAGDIKIAVKQLGGDGYFSFGAATDSIPSASTYKLYVMLRTFDDINQGKRKWDDQIVGDSLSTCFERMIVVSANNCSEDLIKQFGAQKLTDYLRAKGFSSGTGFNFSDATHSTAADLLKLLIGIEDGSLVKGQNRDMLLEKMGRQIYRNGIPAGSAGTVYDKVGFLWDYNHDAAIVKHPKGTYALSVMTKGHSFAKVAEITRELERIMYP